MKFSIIIPCYNVEKYIKKTLESILFQKYSNFQIVTIDDGSKDRTSEIIKEMAVKDNRITYFYQENSGVSNARNKGIELAMGDYVYFLDGDDIIENDLLFDIAKILESNKDVEMVSFGYRLLKKQKIKKIYSNKKYDKKILDSKFFLREMLTLKVYQNISSFIIKKEKIKDIKFNSEIIIGEDLDFQMRLLLEKNFDIYYTSNIYFNYLKRKNSATTTNKFNLNTLKTLDSLEKLREKMLKKGIKEFEEYQILRFFYELSMLSSKEINREEFEKIKKKFREYDFILEKLRFKLNKRNIILNILKIIYKINIKALLNILKLKNRE